MKIIFKECAPKAGDYLKLFKTTGWSRAPSAKKASLALKNSVYVVCAWHDAEKRLVGVGRLTGDGFMYAYVNDVIVHPRYQAKGIGTELMNYILRYAGRRKVRSLQLFSAKGKASFYRKLNFKERPKDSPGMYFDFKSDSPR